jgi:zinc transport system ATP-binding protein
MADEAPLSFQRVYFRYDSQWVVEDVSFSVDRSDFLAILGPNGSGKTTLLRLALGLLRPSQGTILLFGQPPERFREWWRVGYVPQRMQGLETGFPATVEEVVAQGLYRGFDPLAPWLGRGKQAIAQAMKTAGIAELKARRLTSLSLGQQQRALLARALVRRPELLVLDEPVSGIDAVGQEQFYALLRRLNHELGMTVMLVSHDIGVVMREATTVACFNRTMVFHGPRHRLTSQELSQLYGFPAEVLLHDILHEHR